MIVCLKVCTYFHAEERDTGEEVDSGLEVSKLFIGAGRKVVPVRRQILLQRIVQRIQ